MDHEQQRDYVEERDAQHVPHAEAGLSLLECPCSDWLESLADAILQDTADEIWEAIDAT